MATITVQSKAVSLGLTVDSLYALWIREKELRSKDAKDAQDRYMSLYDSYRSIQEECYALEDKVKAYRTVLKDMNQTEEEEEEDWDN